MDGRSVLVVAAHPDDDVLGCGGTIARYRAAGAQIHVGFLADGVSSRSDDGVPDPEALRRRRDAAKRACEILGEVSVSFGDLPDNRMDTVPLLTTAQEVEALVDEHRPDTVLTHHAGDLNIDHRLTHQAVVTACRPQPGHSVMTLLCFEVASSTEWQTPDRPPAFAPNWFVDISATLERKLEALEAYVDELRDWPHARSRQAVEHLARWRGATVGAEAAEAFVLARHLG